jgi:hypothetical protein
MLYPQLFYNYIRGVNWNPKVKKKIFTMCIEISYEFSTVCGIADFPIDFLRGITEYQGFSSSDKVIQYFWETIAEFTPHGKQKKKKKKFIYGSNFPQKNLCC